MSDTFPIDEVPAGQGETTGVLKGKFLVASHQLYDATFVGTVILVTHHDAEGARGVVVNRPLGVTVETTCGKEVEAARNVDLPLFHGGPCAGALVALHNIEEIANRQKSVGVPEVDALLPWGETVLPGVWLCSRRDALETLMRYMQKHKYDAEETEDAPTPAVKFAFGYAGWQTGQLENEIAEGYWLLLDARPGDVFEGVSPKFETIDAATTLPPGSLELLAILRTQFAGHDPTAALAIGLRQWVRLYTKINLSQYVDPARIPDEPSLN